MKRQATVNASVFIQDTECIIVKTHNHAQWPVDLVVNGNSGAISMYLTLEQAERIADLLTAALKEIDASKTCHHCGQAEHF